MRALGLTWFEHRRMTGLCEGLGIELHVIQSTRRGWRRYLSLVLPTLQLLRERKPEVLLVQNPSLVLTLLTTLVRPLFGYRLVVDAHNEGVEPYIHKTAAVLKITKWLLRMADLTIVTNSWLASTVERAGGSAFVLPDRLPQVEVAASPIVHDQASLRVAVIATYAPDEPIEAILEAARTLQSKVRLSFTGNFHKLPLALRQGAPGNVDFKGFLDEEEYWTLLRQSDAVLDLSTMDNCLVCGAYEAVALGRPSILSDNPACRELFQGAAVFAGATTESIVQALQLLRADHQPLTLSTRATAEKLRQRWALGAAALLQKMEAIAEGAGKRGGANV